MKTILQVLILTVVLTAGQLYGQTDQTPPPVPSQEEPEVLNQGPIHEAFAQPLDLTFQAGIIAPIEPPAVITENPAAERPRGSEYVWIPGYWAWDAERNDYVWISGCWRVPPTGMSWMPGYWNKVAQGWQWVAGFWIPTAQANQVQYLPQPPEIADAQPPAVSITSDNLWVPPCYYWQGNSYILRPGYWLAPQANWVWIPSHYSWTPYGYVFVPGYWDYVLTTRGILYAPVYFPRHFHRPAGYSYSLGVVVNIGNLEFSLFSYPRYCHYYFGDYYSDFYIGIGIYPWFEFETRHGWYDPIYEYDRCHYRYKIPHWDEHIRREYDMRRADVNLRPPRTYRELESRSSKISARQRNNIQMVEPIRTYSENKNAPLKFSQMNDRERQKVVSHTNDVNNFRQQRRQLESKQPAPAVQTSKESRASEQVTTQQKSRTVSTPQQTRSAGSSTEAQKPSERRESAPAAVQPSRESKSPQQITSEQKSRTVSSPQQTKSAEPIETARPSERAPSEKQGSVNRSSSEKKNFPKSPVTGKSSPGLFKENTPSQPEREGNIKREPDNNKGTQGDNRSGGGRGRG